MTQPHDARTQQQDSEHRIRQTSKIYRERDASGNFPPRTEAEELAIEKEIDAWWALIRATR